MYQILQLNRIVSFAVNRLHLSKRICIKYNAIYINISIKYKPRTENSQIVINFELPNFKRENFELTTLHVINKEYEKCKIKI